MNPVKNVRNVMKPVMYSNWAVNLVCYPENAKNKTDEKKSKVGDHVSPTRNEEPPKKRKKDSETIKPDNIVTATSTIGSIKIKSDEYMFPGINEIKRFEQNFKNDIKNPPNVFNETASNVSHVNNIISLRDIEHLIEKYFGKSEQDAIVIIANILSLFIVSHNRRINAKTQTITNIPQLLDNKMLGNKLIAEILKLTNKMVNADYEPALIIMFLSILIVFKKLNDLRKLQFGTGSQFSKVRELLCKIFKASDNFDASKILVLFQSQFFRTDCENVIKLIDTNRNSGIMARFTLFYSSPSEIDKYHKPFKSVVDVMLLDKPPSKERITELIDKAINEYRLNSSFNNVTKATDGPVRSVVPVQLVNIPNTRPTRDVISNSAVDASGGFAGPSMSTSHNDATNNGINIESSSPSQSIIWSPPTKCDKINCKNAPLIKCRDCKSVFYCSLDCQTQHWYASHVFECADIKPVVEKKNN